MEFILEEEKENMELTVGTVLEGKVKSITNFGAFVALPENQTGMVHISEVANAYVSDIRQHLTEGQDVKVVVIGDRDMENGTVSVRTRKGDDLGAMTPDEFIAKCLMEIASKSKEV